MPLQTAFRQARLQLHLEGFRFLLAAAVAPVRLRHVAEHLLDVVAATGVRRTFTGGALHSATHTPQGIN